MLFNGSSLGPRPGGFFGNVFLLNFDLYFFPDHIGKEPMNDARAKRRPNRAVEDELLHPDLLHSVIISLV